MVKKLFLCTCGIALLIASLGCTNPYTPAGHEGFVYEKPRFFGKGGFRGTIKGPGNFGVSLWRNEVINIDSRPQNYTENFKILTNDDLNISFRFNAIIAITPGNVQDIVQDYGGVKWYERFLREPFRTIVRDAVQHYSSREVKEKRDIIAHNVAEKLQDYINESPFKLVSLVVGNIDYPDSVAKAVEKKLAAQQLLEEKMVQKDIAMRNAEIRIEEAKGIAAAQKIINSTLTANYLQHEAINAQKTMANSPNHTTVYIPVGPNGIPIVYTPKR
ncbi:MAG: SPFH domain-containing protein [Thermodesulfobacteriota bacterium]|nr:SPFH domain-containing protein [Thermodesulfobacteriota bacterium]